MTDAEWAEKLAIADRVREEQRQRRRAARVGKPGPVPLVGEWCGRCAAQVKKPHVHPKGS